MLHSDRFSAQLRERGLNRDGARGESVTKQFGLRSTLDEAGIPQLEFPKPFNIAALLIDRHLAEGRGDKVAVRTLERDVTYAELVANVNRFGNALRMLGLRPGDRLAMVVKDCPKFVYLFFGAIKVGVIPFPLNSLLRADDFAFIFEDSRCAGVVYSPEFAQEVEAAVVRSSWRPAHVLPLQGQSSFGELARTASSDLTALPTQADDDCFWLYSSGTSGRPKGVVHVHGSVAVTCQRFAVEMLGADDRDVFFSVPRLYFSYGLGCAMTNPLWVGGTAILDDRRPTPQTVAEVFRRFRPSIFAGVPTFYAALLNAGVMTKADFPNLRRALSGGEATPIEIMRRWRELTGLPITEVIGSTETLHIYMGNRIDDARVGTLGKPVPGYQVKLVDEHNRIIDDERPGRLWVRGQSLARCYWNNPEKTAQTFVDGWMDTGDTMYRDADGYYVYCGRADDMMKVSGRFVSPFEIESTIVEDARVLEAAVVGRPDRDGLIGIQAVIVLKNATLATEATADEIRGLCKSRLAHYKYPKWITFVDQLPKTATGKIQRYKLRSECASLPS
jgi:benzoate-CoA ligase family protein